MASKEPHSFKSIQILSTKAHELWSKARSAREEQQKKPPMTSRDIEEYKGPDATIAIELGSVVKATLAILGIYIAANVLFIIRDKLFILGLGFFLSIVIDSSVRFLERRKIPRSMAVLIVYLIFISIALFLIASLVPIVAGQLQDLARLINHSADDFLANPQINLPFVPETFNAKLSNVSHEIFDTLQIKDRASALLQFGQNLSLAAQTSLAFAVQVAGSVVNFILSFILILFLAFFIQMEKEKISDYFLIFFPRRYRHYIHEKTDEVYVKMSQWAQGQLLLCLALFILSYVALTILQVPYALTLALLAGFMEFIPYAGPIIAAVPAILVGFTSGGFVLAIIVFIIYYVIQLTENHVLVPLIMKHTVGLSPILVIFSMLVAVSFPSTVHPIVGIIIAVPLTTIITLFIDDLRQMTRKK